MLTEYTGTTEAGAGSYPEPPDVPEYTGPICERCGDYGEDAKLRQDEDGRVLCKWCMEKEVLETASSQEMLDFIEANCQQEFYKEDLLPYLDSVNELYSLLRQKMKNWDEDFRAKYMRNFLDDYRSDFLNFIQRGGNQNVTV